MLALGLLAFGIYIDWLATPRELRFIGANHLDKLAHLAGGVFLALFFEWRIPGRQLLLFIGFLTMITMGWEVLEFSFDAETRYFYALNFDLWFLDSLGDIVAGFLGGYGYWVFLMNRGWANAKTKTP